MTMVPGNDGVSLDNIDLTHAKDIECEKELIELEAQLYVNIS